MKRGLLIALAAIAVLGLMAPLTAHAHDGPVMVAVLDAAPPTSATGATIQNMPLLAADLAVVLNTTAVSYDSAGRTERVGRLHGTSAAVAAENRKPESRARDVPSSDYARG